MKSGTSVTAVITKGDWMQIEPPTNAYAFRGRDLFEAGSILGNQCAGPHRGYDGTTAAAANADDRDRNTASCRAAAHRAAAAGNGHDHSANDGGIGSTADPLRSRNDRDDSAEPTLAPEDTNLPPPPPRIVTHEGSVAPFGQSRGADGFRACMTRRTTRRSIIFTARRRI